MFTEENLPGEFHVYVDTDSSTNEDVGLQADIQLCLHALVWGEGEHRQGGCVVLVGHLACNKSSVMLEWHVLASKGWSATVALQLESWSVVLVGHPMQEPCHLDSRGHRNTGPFA